MFIVIVMFILSFSTCAIFINSKWKVYSSDRNWLFPLIDRLRRYNILSRIWPCDDRFMSLTFSAFRHTLIPFVFALIMWYVNNEIWNTISLYLTLLYALSILPRYKERRKDFLLAGEASRKFLKPVKSACFSVIICAFANYFILLFCYSLCQR